MLRLPGGNSPINDLVRAYRAGTPIAEAVTNRASVNQWLATHQNMVVASPMLQKFDNEVKALNIESPSPQEASLAGKATHYVREAIHTFANAPTDQLEAMILSNDDDNRIEKLTAYFKRSPLSVFQYEDLLKTHVALGTLQPEDLVSILKGAAEKLIENPSFKFPSMESSALCHRSLLATFSSELANVNLTDHPETMEGLLCIVDQDTISQAPYFNDPANVDRFYDALTQNNPDQLRHILRLVPMDKIVEVVGPNAEGISILQNEQTLEQLAPVLFDRLSREDLNTVLETLRDYRDFGQNHPNPPPNPSPYDRLFVNNCRLLRQLSETQQIRALGLHYHSFSVSGGTDVRYFPQYVQETSLPPAAALFNTYMVEHTLRGNRNPRTMDEQIADLERKGASRQFVLAALAQNLEIGTEIYPGLLRIPEIAPYLRKLKTSTISTPDFVAFISKCKNLNILEMENANEMPFLPNLQDLKIDNPSVSELQTFPQLRTLNLGFRSSMDSDSFKRIAPQPRCRTVELSSLLGLISVEALPSCRSIRMGACNNLRRLPPMPLCWHFTARSNNLETLPLLANGAVIETRAWEQAFQANPARQMRRTSAVTIHTENFSNNPKKVLHQLGEQLSKELNFPTITTYTNNRRDEGVDAGGVSTDSVSELTDKLFKTSEELNKMVKEAGTAPGGWSTLISRFLGLEQGINTSNFLLMDERMPISRGPSEETSYRYLGRVLARCTEPGCRFKTGPIFSETVYKCLVTPGDCIEPSKEWLLRNAIHAFDLPGVVMDLVDLEKPVPPDLVDLPEAIKWKLYGYINEDSSEVDFSAPENRVALRNALIKAAQDDPRIKAIQWMAKEMRDYFSEEEWGAIEAAGAKQLQNAIEGVITPQAVKATLNWIGYEGPIKGWLVEWIDGKSSEEDKEDLRDFVKFCTGAKGVFAETKINIHVYGGRDPERFPESHTCSTQLDLAPYRDKATFIEKLEHAIKTTGFQVA